ncbi:ZrgA family zinc uptake protein [Pseudoalteromonas sp. AOP31-A2-14]|uniref:ZrgA family zinc uptake protein n=1 Tax=Pseudoalteromonas sp. AOP31-A2-14 TaxID=3457695 RepID=UPI003FB97EBE
MNFKGKHYLQLELLFFSLLSFAAFSHQHQHVYGEGELFIVQQQNQWHIELMLPAQDVLGFEHQPETPEQIQHVSALTERLLKIDSVINIDSECTLSQSDYELPSTSGHLHHDITVEYLLHCKTPINQLTLTIFEWISSLQKVDVQWSHNKGQGAVVLEPNKPNLDWSM